MGNSPLVPAGKGKKPGPQKMLKNTNRVTFSTAVGHSVLFFYYLIYILFVYVCGMIMFSVC